MDDGSARRVLLLDTSAFIAGYGAGVVGEEHYTVPAVRDELREGGLPRIRFENAVQAGSLKLLSPDPQSLEELKWVARELGEEGSLSEVDLQLLALGLSLKYKGLDPIIVSDDYSIQNVADRLELGFRSLATAGIKERFHWVIYCPGCRRAFQTIQEGNICPVCGTTLKMKPGTKKRLDRAKGVSSV
ncbi:MAG: hypothetical protein JSV18_07020 [Candidatus Bathyarchaeota archaeon]|nr:MAG: hypothetical protein JSV18_07020 [Candidatus Bathyarchaeota archaeon]